MLLVDQQGRADRSAQVAERGQAHLRRAIVDEKMGMHALRDPVDVLVPEPLTQAAADDHRLWIDQVDR